MVDQPHGCLAGNARPPEPVDVSDAEAVEAEVGFADFDEELLPAAGGLEGEVQGEGLAGGFELFEDWPQGCGHGDGEGAVFAAFGGREGDLIFPKIDAAHR